MGRTKVILHGGLGNQLFQWAYGHRLAMQGMEVEFLFLLQDNLVPHTNSSMSNIFPECGHGFFNFKELPKNKILRVLNDPIHRFSPQRLIAARISDTTENPFDLPDSEIRSKYHYGYYQNSGMVYDLKSTLLKELWKNLSTFVQNPFEKELYGAEILHVRQGDTTTPINMQKVGVLSSEYYENLPGTKNRRFVLTDDKDGAAKILRRVKNDGIFGPDEIDKQSALRVMANSKKLFTANSTLSWWGAFLAVENGAEVVIPDLFFRGVIPPEGSAFKYPGFNFQESIFMDQPIECE